MPLKDNPPPKKGDLELSSGPRYDHTRHDKQPERSPTTNEHYDFARRTDPRPEYPTGERSRRFTKKELSQLSLSELEGKRPEFEQYSFKEIDQYLSDLRAMTAKLTQTFDIKLSNHRDTVMKGISQCGDDQTRRDEYIDKSEQDRKIYIEFAYGKLKRLEDTKDFFLDVFAKKEGSGELTLDESTSYHNRLRVRLQDRHREQVRDLYEWQDKEIANFFSTKDELKHINIYSLRDRARNSSPLEAYYNPEMWLQHETERTELLEHHQQEREELESKIQSALKRYTGPVSTSSHMLRY